MAKLDKNVIILLHLQGYCKEIKDTIEYIKNDKKKYDNNYIIRNSIAMDLFQIGELVKRLDNEFIEETKETIEWNKIKGMRNRLAHQYLDIDYEIVYDVAINDVPKFQDFLEKELKKRIKE